MTYNKPHIAWRFCNNRSNFWLLSAKNYFCLFASGKTALSKFSKTNHLALQLFLLLQQPGSRASWSCLTKEDSVYYFLQDVGNLYKHMPVHVHFSRKSFSTMKEVLHNSLYEFVWFSFWNKTKYDNLELFSQISYLIFQYHFEIGKFIEMS